MFYEFLKEPENDTKKLKQHNFLGNRRYYDWMQIIKWPEEVCPQEVAKLATVVTISVARVFFYSPWRPKRSQLGALATVFHGIQSSFRYLPTLYVSKSNKLFLFCEGKWINGRAATEQWNEPTNR